MAPLYLSMDIPKRLDHGSQLGPPKSVRQRQRSCLLWRDLRSLWQTDFATPLVMTQYIAWWTCFGGTFPPSKILSSAFY